MFHRANEAREATGLSSLQLVAARAGTRGRPLSCRPFREHTPHWSLWDIGLCLATCVGPRVDLEPFAVNWKQSLSSSRYVTCCKGLSTAGEVTPVGTVTCVSSLVDLRGTANPQLSGMGLAKSSGSLPSHTLCPSFLGGHFCARDSFLLQVTWARGPEVPEQPYREMAGLRAACQPYL